MPSSHLFSHRHIRRRRRNNNLSGAMRTLLSRRLSLFLFLSFFILWTVWTSLVSPSSISPFSLTFSSSQDHDHDIWVKPNAEPFNFNSKTTDQYNHLIMVAGHSVTVSGHLQDAGVDESDWYLLDYQKHAGMPQTIVAHIREGIRLASEDQNSLLIFSGGETRAVTGPINEGTSYFRVADAMDLWHENGSSSVRTRTVTEEFATDSFQNLLFSICRFREITQHYPQKITVVSFTFKQWRFETLHATALHYPPDQFQYVGIDPDASTGFDLQKSQKGERENAALPFTTDPYGCHTPTLIQKRATRNPFHRTPPYELSCPDMKDLLNWCGPEIIDRNKVPW